MGNSNNISVHQGSLRKTMYEQTQQISIKKKKKSERSKLRKYEMLERYREERLLMELRMLEEEKRQLQWQQKQEIMKEKRR